MLLSTLLKAAVVAAFSYAVIALILLVVRTRSFGMKPSYAIPEGSARRGVLYAFVRGMLPWEKESVATHLPTFVAGLLYHAGVFTALLFLLLLMIEAPPTHFLSQIFRALVLAGLVSGLGLLIKRVTSRKMRVISVPDDFVANALVDLFLGLAFVAMISPAVTPVFLIAATVLFLYMPMGKIRHCVFFFYTRFVFGVFFGRRGVLPHPPREA